MSIPVGLTVPKLLPITGTFAPLFATYFGFLAYRVSAARIESNRLLGTPEKSTTTNTSTDPDELIVASRSHANFSENVPLALLLGTVVELNGGDRRALTVGLSALFVFRVLHVELGLRGKDAMGKGRIVGHFGTLGFIVGFAGYAAYLVKGYWLL